jgi:hypothetical protein
MPTEIFSPRHDAVAVWSGRRLCKSQRGRLQASYNRRDAAGSQLLFFDKLNQLFGEIFFRLESHGVCNGSSFMNGCRRHFKRINLVVHVGPLALSDQVVGGGGGGGERATIFNSPR